MNEDSEEPVDGSSPARSAVSKIPDVSAFGMIALAGLIVAVIALH